MSRIAFIGGGNMSSCIFNGIRKSRGREDEITVSGPHIEKLSKFQEQGAEITCDNVKAAAGAEVVFLGVKPQMLTAVLQELAAGGVDFKNKLVISMAAGFRIASIERLINSARIIRIMPNTPAHLGLGVVGIYFGSTGEEDQKLTLELLSALGQCPVLKSEEEINLIGAIAGSAPAFLYRFLEALVAEGVKAGLPKAQSRQIIEQMALGTASMVINNPDRKISELREAVTSKGGTTFEGLAVMTNFHFEEMISQVIKATMDKTHKFEGMF